MQHLKVMSVLKSLGISNINCGIAASVYAPRGEGVRDSLLLGSGREHAPLAFFLK